MFCMRNKIIWINIVNDKLWYLTNDQVPDVQFMHGDNKITRCIDTEAYRWDYEGNLSPSLVTMSS